VAPDGSRDPFDHEPEGRETPPFFPRFVFCHKEKTGEFDSGGAEHKSAMLARLIRKCYWKGNINKKGYTIRNFFEKMKVS